MEAVYLIILLVVLAGVVWWRVNAKKSAAARETSTGPAVGQPERPRAEGGLRTDGALSGGSAAASAEAAGTTGIPSAAGFGRPAEPAAPVTADEPAETAATAHDAPTAAVQHGGAGSSAIGTTDVPGGEARTAAGAYSGEGREERRIKDEAEWETQWSEASGPAPAHEGAGHRESATAAAHVPASETGSGTAPAGTTDKGTANQQPVHHAEYTAPQAPTLPGAETAAVEEPEDTRNAAAAPQPSAAGTGNTTPSPRGTGVGLPSDAATAETLDRTQSSALVESGADHTQDQPAGTEPAGHLAAQEPYGAGSASAAADGSGPADYTVKGDAGAMVYYEEGHPEYEQTRADVWFDSPAHAEAAGFRAPRRRRI